MFANLALCAVLCKGFDGGLVGFNVSHDSLMFLEQRLQPQTENKGVSFSHMWLALSDLGTVFIFAIVTTADKRLLLFYPGLCLLSIAEVLLCLQRSLQGLLSRLSQSLKVNE